MFCRQLIMLADVYRASEVGDHICPIALTLSADRVAEVRHISYKLVSIAGFYTNQMVRCFIIVDNYRIKYNNYLLCHQMRD
jgi:hypothetical protein